MALHDTGTGSRATDRQTAEMTEGAVRVRIVIHETETHERIQLGCGVVADFSVVLAAPLVVGRGGHVVSRQTECPAAWRVRCPAGEVENSLNAGIDAVPGDDVIGEWPAPCTVRIAGRRIVNRSRRSGEVSSFHCQSGHLDILRDAFGVVRTLVA